MCRHLTLFAHRRRRLDAAGRIHSKCLDMTDRRNADRPLSSWKEISAYLGCDQRTCLRWEKKHGLPIHRVGEGSAKAHVYAYREELDQWLRKRSRSDEPPVSPEPPRDTRLGLLKRRRWPALVLLGGGLGLVLIAAFIGRGSRTGSEPNDFRIEGAQIVILDKAGREVWRHDTGVSDLQDEAYYRARFQSKSVATSGARLTPLLMIRDINGDGRREVLFSPESRANLVNGSVLCFDDRGRLLWAFDPARERTFGSKRYPPQYGIQCLDFFSRGAGFGTFLLVVAHQRPEFPTYAAILTPTGELKGEYWNSGRLFDYALMDVGNDGKDDLILAGTNNEFLKACLIVLDPDNARGASPQTGEYKAADLPPGSEEYYLLFPRTDMDRLTSFRESFNLVSVAGPDRLMAWALESGIFFGLNSRMEVSEVIDADSFWAIRRRLQDEGRLPPGRLDPSELRRSLAAGVLYWDGTAWISTPTPNRRNG